MFTAQLEHIFTKEHFSEAFGEISKNAGGLDEVRYGEFKAEFGKNIEELAHAKAAKTVTTKKEFRIFLDQIELHTLFDLELIEDKKELSLAKGYERYLANKNYKESHAKIDKKKNHYAKKFANDSTLHINTHGLMLGISKNKFVIKEYGKVKNFYPFDKVTRIIFEGKGFSISSDVLKKCADNAITVDFIDHGAKRS
jgi:hypothetical protein